VASLSVVFGNGNISSLSPLTYRRHGDTIKSNPQVNLQHFKLWVPQKASPVA
jgi:hypothetical protein